METGLQGKVAVITGGGGAIGRACARALAGEGANVVVVDLEQGVADDDAAAARAGGARTLGLAADITREADVAALVGRVRDTFGRFDVLVNCAGIFQAVPLEELSLADWQRVLDVNLTGMFLCGREALRAMRARGSGGRIVNIASLAGQVGGLAAGANYSVSRRA